MLQTILRTGAFNTTLLAVLAGLGWVVLARPFHPPRWIVRAVLLGFAFGTAANLALGVYRSFTVPRDVMQDIIAAREYSAGRPMHPDDMKDRIRAALDEEGPRPSLLYWSPELAAQEREQRERMLAEHWVQAHPPFMTLVTVPCVRALGILGTQLLFSMLALISLGWTLHAIRRELWPDLGWPVIVGVALAAYGWSPVVSVVRLQQPGLLLAALLVASWVLLRRGRPTPAGAAIAVAAALKVIPVLLILPLLIQSRRAFGAAVLTGVAILGVILATVPIQDLIDYRTTTDGVIDEYAAYSTNTSLLGMYARSARVLGLSLASAKIAWELTSAVLVIAWFGALIRRRGPVGIIVPDVDLEFAIGMSFIPLISPVAWDHYDVFLILPLAVLAHRLWWGGAGRASWLAFWAIVFVFSLPDQAYLAAYDAAESVNWIGLEVGVLEPLRTFFGLALALWLLWWRAFRLPIRTPDAGTP